MIFDTFNVQAQDINIENLFAVAKENELLQFLQFEEAKDRIGDSELKVESRIDSKIISDSASSIDVNFARDNKSKIDHSSIFQIFYDCTNTIIEETLKIFPNIESLNNVFKEKENILNEISEELSSTFVRARNIDKDYSNDTEKVHYLFEYFLIIERVQARINLLSHEIAQLNNGILHIFLTDIYENYHINNHNNLNIL